MIHYLIQVVSFQLVFLLVYELLLRKQSFFNWNRIYLLGTSALSLLLPFMKIDLFSSVGEDFGVIALPEVILGSTPDISELNKALMETAGIPVAETAMPFWQILLLTGSVLFGLWFVISWLRLVLLRINNPNRWKNDVLIISLKDSFHAFSFFKSIYIGSNINYEDRAMILEHELVHVRQWHSLDIVWFQLLRIALWFNPAVYWYHKRTVELHEYIADEKVIKQQGRANYYKNLLRQALQVPTLSLSNAFFSKSLVRKRINRLQQLPSNKKELWRFLVIIPMLVSMLFYVSCDKEVQGDSIFSEDHLEQYTRRWGFTLSAEQKKERKNEMEMVYEDFFLKNKDYVVWAYMDFDAEEVINSIHHKDEKPTFKYIEFERQFPGGTKYQFIMNVPSRFSEYYENGKAMGTPIQGNGVEVPYAVIDQVPTFESCAQLSGEERKKCTSMEVAKFVNLKFNTDLAIQYNLSGRQRIYVYFKIGKDGSIIDIGARAPHPALEDEAKRVIQSLPQFIPGEHKGEKVVVPYSLPILFQVQ
jgi:hypothetical protein